MKKFLINTFIFSTILVTICYLLSFVADCGLKKSNQQEWASWNDIFTSKVSDSIVIFGGSRAHGGYNSKIIEDSLKLSCYNLGMNGYTIDLIYQRYNVLLKYNSIPNYVILNVDYLTTMEISKWPYQMTQYLPYTREPLFEEYFKRVGFDWKKRYIPLYKYSDCVDKLQVGIQELISTVPANRYKGFGNDNIVFDGSTLYDAVENKTKFKVYSDKDALDMCDDFVMDCQKKGIKLIVVLAPHYYLVTENMDNKETLDMYLNSLKDRFNIPVLDYTNFLSKDSTCFANGTHLSKKGADLFTKQLSQDLRKYL